jgi:dTDP-4-amino-4,6-dideoxygalactose transaminase
LLQRFVENRGMRFPESETRAVDHETEMFPQADAAYQTMLSIPLFTAMSDFDQDRVITALGEVLT